MQNSVVWFELPADNPERARKFYEKVFDWKITHNPGLDIYLLGTAPSDERGRSSQPGAINGMMSMRRNADSTTSVTIEVSDVDSVVEKLERYGGRVVQKKQLVPQVGYVVYFKDPEGNLIQLFQRA